MPALLLLAKITVYAAASLTNVFPQIDSSPTYSFAGSNTLAAQIQLGAPADVFASANTALPQQLWQKGLCTQPVVFTRNTLVLIVPRSNSAGIRGVYDLQKAGVKLDVAAPGVPVGQKDANLIEPQRGVGFDQSPDLAGDRFQLFERLCVLARIEHGKLRFLCRVPDADANQEAIELRLR